MNLSQFIKEASWITLIIFNVVVAGVLTLILHGRVAAYNVEDFFKGMLGLVFIVEILLFELGGKIYEDLKNLL